MALSYRTLAGRFACALLAGGIIRLATVAVGAQQIVPANQIINALAPPVTRSLTAPKEPAMSPADRAFIDSLRGRTRSLTVDQGERVEKIKVTNHLRNTDFEVYFDFNSAATTSRAEAQLNELAKALRSPDLEGTLFLVGGYTDATGGAKYNQKLSERRAEAVKRYLVEKLEVSAKDLETVGYGKRHLKDPSHPRADENRRVQIVNLESANKAER